MFRAFLGLALVAGVGCSHPNKGVCCETAQQCEVIGLSADSVGKYNCDDGLVCVNETCVIPTDSGPMADGDDEGSGSGNGSGSGSGTSNARCDLAKPFAAPVLVPNINNGYAEKVFVLSANELTGYILRDNRGDMITLTSTSRLSLDDDFPIDGTDSHLANVGGRIDNVRIARSDHLWFERYNGILQVSERANTTEPFGPREMLSIGGVTNSSLRLVGTDPDALTLYFTGADNILQAAPNHFMAYEFNTPVLQSTVEIDDAAISRDGLSLFYTRPGDAGNGDVYVSIRSSTNDKFDSGTMLFAGAGVPTYVTADSCELYIAGADVRVARRPK